MSLAELKGILVPPLRGGDTVQWAEVEAQLRTSLPEDYKQFLEEYGTGSIGNFLWVLSPATTNKSLNLMAQCTARLDAMRESRRGSGSRQPYGIFPEPGGVIPWGFTDNGDVCFWRTGAPNPNAWPTVICEGRGAMWERFDGSMAEFMAAVLVHTYYSSEIFPDDLPSSFRAV